MLCESVPDFLVIIDQWLECAHVFIYVKTNIIYLALCTYTCTSSTGDTCSLIKVGFGDVTSSDF